MLVGKVLGNRYRLTELIGEGGMALVYKAECSLLRRTVAVKILRPQYASDTDFVERFRHEAQAAASLSHPNVVNIYDVGQENGLDYIVMEYIPGDNLKNLIKKEAPFSVQRALEFTRQIAEALQQAHRRNIVHRDIKPHNILVTSDGQVKVTDFGIARAISASSLTQAGMVVGSVQYASPEQTRGDEVGPQSDLYSLGCVLYEMLTGTVPFKGETSIAIAMQHLENDIIPIRQLRPSIPPEIEYIVRKAMAKNLERRYSSAAAMLKEIVAAQAKFKVVGDAADETDIPTQAWRPVTPKKTKLGEWSWLAWLTLIAGASFGLVLLVTMMVYMFLPARPTVEVPNIVGKDLAAAREILKENNLKMKVAEQLFSLNYPADTVLSQKPASGQKKKSGSEVEVVVSKGPQLVRVPDLVGKARQDAEIALKNAGLLVGETLAGSSSDYPEGVVIKQLPEANTQIQYGARVSITLNSGSNLVEIPNFIGKSIAEAQAELGAWGLSFNQATPVRSDLYAEGIVVDQQPSPGKKVPLGTAMSFMVSSGKH